MADNQSLAWLSKAIQEYSETKAPITFALLLVVGAVFVFEISMTVRHSLAEISIFATGLFGVAPRDAWLLSPVLHRGPQHFFGTFVMLLVVGIPVERHWTSRCYTLFLVSTGNLSIIGGAVVLSSLSDQQVAFYGTSGVIFGLAGFALTHLSLAHSRLTHIDMIAIGVGVSSLALVLIDPITGAYLAPRWINGGHLVGFVIGAVVGWFRKESCPLPNENGEFALPRFEGYLR